MKYYIIAGEASGDLHGSNLIKGLREADPEADCRIWGGDLMEAAGGQLVKHYRELAFMGFVEVLMNLRTILGNMKFCKQDILRYQPDALILIDYPGFNLRIAKWAKAEGLKVYYYISPQLWAWHSSRVHGIKASVDRLFVILPFEQDFYQQYDYEVDFVGHPLMDVVDERPARENFREEHQLSSQPIIALLPGSRKQEIERMLEVMLEVVPDFPEHQFVIAGAPAQPESFYRQIVDKARPDTARVKLVDNRTYALLRHAEAALVTSGTATLETALFGVPQVVCYRGGRLSYLIARRLIDVEFIALANLIAGKEVVKELIQQECNARNLKAELKKLLEPEHRQRILEGYRLIRERMGEPGASRRTAELIVGYLRESERVSEKVRK
ncbi:MAG: lipid-A-disaccharide synthase [Lewinellaceae bacterium]|nr:lipid-A-disaccharide synthase [Phaeodactylibacter sp.]MCB9349212.1 lipid-A-disaccharide synthase [Lewinellaceae bacterium]